MELKRTPLFDWYEAYGGKVIDFGGWALPVQFSSIKHEHEAVRQKVGLFDVSHMGEIVVVGEDAQSFLQSVLTNDLSRIQVGQAQYNLMCNEAGGVVDDLIVYRLQPNQYLLCVNAANIEKDTAWLLRHQLGNVTIENVSNEFAQLALQGPLAKDVLQKIVSENLDNLSFMTCLDQAEVAGQRVLLSRTGYTGEDGFELYGAPQAIQQLWQTLLANEQVVPAGLGARDTLRFESGLPLYGQEISETITPLEAGLQFAVKFDTQFIGKEALMQQKEEGVPRKLVGIEMVGKGIARHGYPIVHDGQLIGHVTTGTQLPLSKRNVGLALVQTPFAQIGQQLFIDIRGKEIEAVVVQKPFYKRSK